MLSHEFPLPYTILVFDVDRYGDPSRTDLHRTAVHDGLNRAVRRAFVVAGVEWDSCDWQDGGDGALILIPVDTPKAVVLNRVVRYLADHIREHNEVSAPGAGIRLRLCLHAADVRRTEYGVVGSGIILVSRLLDSAELRNECRNSPEPITLAVTDWFFREVVRHDPVADPAKFREIRFRVKETETAAWVKSAGHPPPPVAPPAPASPDRLTVLVEALMEVPSVRDDLGRQTLLELLPRSIGGAVRYQPRTRPHVFELVRTCRDYDDGVTALFTALRQLEGDSGPVRRAEAAAREWTRAEEEIG
ncbi:effector-associated domain 2-containing protein [Actinosynnema sp. CS-041913]|uniref:effector-associated domain 2-containing protein n=1 Tax=Actinosynnema sp. CS-041913 TaxID=3239917 RepID=UPI003D92E582